MIDADEIFPALWQGAVPPRGEILAGLGFDAVVLAAVELQMPADWYPGVDVIYAPNNDDGTAMTREQLALAIQAARDVVARIRDGQKVLVSCAQGLNRSGLVSALTLHFLLGWDGERCIRAVRGRRSGKALTNPYFTRALRMLPVRQDIGVAFA